MQRCSHCNSKLKKNIKFCPKCGIAVTWDAGDSDILEKKSAKMKLPLIMTISLVIVAAVALFAFGKMDALNIIPTETSTPVLAFSDDPSAISIASQSVVKLNCYDKNDKLYSMGSGFACFADNIIVTNYHVIEGNVYKIEAFTEDGQRFKVNYVLATDKQKDIALLTTIRPHNLPLLQPGNCLDLKKGEKVIAIGSPLGLTNTVSTGVFSGYVDDSRVDVLQFTAPISSGSSGGALLNNWGQVIGITFASYEAGQNINLAIPIDHVVQLYSTTNSKKYITLPQFYDTHIPTYTVSQVVDLREELEGDVFYILGYFYSHGVVYSADEESWETIWCEVYSGLNNGVCSGDRVIISYTAASNEEMPFDLILSKVYADHLKQGDYVRFRCRIEPGSSELTLIAIEHIE